MRPIALATLTFLFVRLCPLAAQDFDVALATGQVTRVLRGGR